MQNNIVYLVQKLHLPIEKDMLRKKILIHFQYPSLNAVTDSLNTVGISHKALHTNFTELLNNGFPCLAHLKEKRQEHLVVLTSIKKGNFNVYDKKKFKLPETVFRKIWTGNILYILPPQKSSLKKKILGWKQEIIFTGLYVNIFILFFLFLPPLIQQMPNNYFVILIILITIGFFISILLIKHETGNTGFTKDICNFRKYFSCEAVLSSPAAKLFGIISLADIGIIYFGSQFLCMLYGILTGQSIVYAFSIGYLSIFTCPYILFSLWYQKFKIKQWCPLCLSVITILLLQITVFSIFNYNHSELHFIVITICFCIFFITASLWLYFREKLFYFQQLKKEEVQLLRLKYHPQIFLTQLRPTLNDPNTDKGGIIIGNNNTEYSLTLILNLFCRPCEIAFTQIIAYQQKHPDQISIKLHLLIIPEQENFIAYFYQIYKEKGFLKIIDVLNIWFLNKNKTEIKKLYPIIQVSQEALNWCKSEIEWIQKAKVNHTPFFLLNNKIIPQYYSLSDLFYFLDIFLQNSSKNKNQ